MNPIDILAWTVVVSTAVGRFLTTWTGNYYEGKSPAWKISGGFGRLVALALFAWAVWWIW